MSHHSFWLEGEEPAKVKKLDRDITAEVVIVGAGMTGLITAYLLTQQGREVVVLERGTVAGGDTGNTTAHLSTIADPGYFSIALAHGQDTARRVHQSHADAINFLEEMTRTENIDCHFKRVPGYWFVSNGDPKESDRQTGQLQKEYEVLARFGLPVQWGEVPSFPFTEGVGIPHQARVHPLQFLNGLSKKLIDSGVEIFTQTSVQEIKKNGELKTAEGFTVKGGSVVIATHAPIEGTLIFLKQAAYRSYVVATEVPKGLLTDALYWDMDDPYHYLRTEPLSETTDLLIAGGEDHKTGQVTDSYEETFARLEKWVTKKFPEVKEFSYRWSGQIIEPVDGLPFIGRIPYHKTPFYMATGYAGNGMTYSVTAAHLLFDLIEKRENDLSKIFDPVRKNIHGLKNFITENWNVAACFTAGRMKEDIASPKELIPGEGGIFKKGLNPLAVYRNEKGELQAVSAVCTHLYCVVQWNSAEKSFDCPCHGSRFSPEGKVLCGPASKPLEKKELEDFDSNEVQQPPWKQEVRSGQRKKAAAVVSRKEHFYGSNS